MIVLSWAFFKQTMKKLEITGYIIFITGLLLKFIHTPFHTYIMAGGILILLATYVYSLVKIKNENIKALAGLTLTFWMIYLFFLLKFLPFSIIPMAAAALITLVFLYFYFTSNESAGFRPFIGVIILVFIITLANMEKYKRYYFLNVYFNINIDRDYVTWDKYSWFLYQANEYNQALIANERALRISQTAQDDLWEKRIQTHHEKIKSRIWKTYP